MITHRLPILYIFFAFILIVACRQSSKQNTVVSENVEEEGQLPDMHNSKIAVDWVGSYKGVIPCADCSGIETVIRLNSDLSYELSRRYLGKADETSNVNSTGEFEWDEQGSIITLDSAGKPMFKVGENKLFKLDREGKVITGELAEKYILTKFSNN